MSSIALFPCSFTPSPNVASSIAASLQLTLYGDNDLIRDTAERYDVPEAKLQKAIFGNTSVFNQFTLEREKMLNLLRSMLAEKLSQQDQHLFFGFMALLIPADVSHVLHVLVVGTKQGRIESAMKNGLTEKEARKAIHADDVKAYDFTDFLFQKEAYNNALYDLVVPVEEKSSEELADIVSQYFHKTSVLRTEKSIQAVANMQLAAKVEQILLQNGHRLEVTAIEGEVQLKVQKSVLLYDKLVTDVTNLVEQIDGVQNVVVEKGYNYNDSIYRRQKFELPSRVLFVDDEKDFVQTVSERLINRDVGTYGVYNGEEALSVIEEDRPDVMVLDLKMPGLYGVEVLRQAKQIAPEVEVIILTGHGSNQDMKDCMELGAFAYLNKPVDIEELSKTIKAANEKALSRSAQAA
ncbi:response regulator [Desulfopila sp. IMCC35008]|uniref:response regulator n=1 Tax=Desulfopila sp. IMCC35008 TaxID=2653858 RepID=UPI0013D8819A|nr:response regulator [Desulfopila sp. IMCC35008]